MWAQVMLLTSRPGLNNPPQVFDFSPAESRWTCRGFQEGQGVGGGHMRERLGGHVEHRGVPILIPDSHTHQTHWAVTWGTNKCHCFKPLRFGVVHDTLLWKQRRKGYAKAWRMRRKQLLGDPERGHSRQRKQHEPSTRAGSVKNWQKAGRAGVRIVEK